MKRLRQWFFLEDEKLPSKRQRTIDTVAKLSQLDNVQSDLTRLEQLCAREQIAVQLRYDRSRQPFFHQRSELVQQIPGFWCAVFCGHPRLQFHLNHPLELKALSCLADFRLKDQIDDRGSCEVCLTLGVNDVFEERIAQKKIVYDVMDEESVHAAKLTAKNEQGQRVIEEANSTSGSLLGWLLSDKAHHPNVHEDFGTLLRRDLWQNPVQYYIVYRDAAKCTSGAQCSQTQDQASGSETVEDSASPTEIQGESL